MVRWENWVPGQGRQAPNLSDIEAPRVPVVRLITAFLMRNAEPRNRALWVTENLSSGHDACVVWETVQVFAYDLERRQNYGAHFLGALKHEYEEWFRKTNKLFKMSDCGGSSGLFHKPCL